MTGLLALLLSNLMPVLGTLITAGLGYLITVIKARQQAATAADKAALAGLQLAAIGTALLQKAWAKLGPDIQTALADGTFSAEERAGIEARVRELLKEVTDDDTLKSIGDALGLPMAGVIAKIVSYLIGKWTEAHDAAVVTSSAKTFPVASSVADTGQLDPNDPIYKAG